MECKEAVGQTFLQLQPGNEQGVNYIWWVYRRSGGTRVHPKSRGLYFFYGKVNKNHQLGA